MPPSWTVAGNSVLRLLLPISRECLPEINLPLSFDRADGQNADVIASIEVAVAGKDNSCCAAYRIIRNANRRPLPGSTPPLAIKSSSPASPLNSKSVIPPKTLDKVASSLVIVAFLAYPATKSVSPVGAPPPTLASFTIMAFPAVAPLAVSEAV